MNVVQNMRHSGCDLDDVMVLFKYPDYASILEWNCPDTEPGQVTVPTPSRRDIINALCSLKSEVGRRASTAEYKTAYEHGFIAGATRMQDALERRFYRWGMSGAGSALDMVSPYLLLDNPESEGTPE